MGMDSVIKRRKDGVRIVVKEHQLLRLQKTSLASLECLAMPLVVLSADFQCPRCQERINDVVSRMYEMESVMVNVLDRTVTLTCKYPLVKKLPAQQVGTLCKRPVSKVALFLKLCRLSKKKLIQ